MARVFTDMEIWVEVRRRVLTGELSKRAACREYEIHWQTLEKILSHSEPPGYQKTKPRSSIVDPFVPIIEEILKSDRQVHRKQRHTARRIFERLRDEHGYVGGETIVKVAVASMEAAPSRSVFATVTPAGRSASRLRFCRCLARGRIDEGCIVRHDTAVFGHDFYSGVSSGMHRSVLGRSSTGLRVLRRRADSNQL